MNVIKTFILILLISPGVYGAKGRLVEGAWQQSWNDVLKEDLRSSGLTEHTDDVIKDLCPKYSRSKKNRMTFWHQLMVSLAWKESWHGPRNWVFFNKGINIGLYQINPLLRNAYGCRGFDLYDPIHNIRCAVKMARRLVDKHGSILVGKRSGLAAYWQPLRASSRLNRKNRGIILEEVKAACKTGKIAYKSTGETLTTFEEMYQEVDLSFNTMDGEDVNLEDEEVLDIEMGVDEDLFFNVEDYNEPVEV